MSTNAIAKTINHGSSRRAFCRRLVFATALPVYNIAAPIPAQAYTPDTDKLRESLYLISRVQEATVQQERFVSNTELQEDLKSKMKLTLRLIEKNYRLLDQITYASAFIDPPDALVEASEAGYDAAESLQSAIDYVRSDLGAGKLTVDQKNFLKTSLQSCREKLFVFLEYMPKEKLREARKRVESENVLNRDEFDGEADAGVYNPVILPWREPRYVEQFKLTT